MATNSYIGKNSLAVGETEKCKVVENTGIKLGSRLSVDKVGSGTTVNLATAEIQKDNCG